MNYIAGTRPALSPSIRCWWLLNLDVGRLESISLSHFKEQFSNYSAEYLLEKRALGDELADEAHAAIEEIFRERGDLLPDRPNRPVLATDISAAPNKTVANAKTARFSCEKGRYRK